jgi:hypothetical protein
MPASQKRGKQAPVGDGRQRGQRAFRIFTLSPPQNLVFMKFPVLLFLPALLLLAACSREEDPPFITTISELAALPAVLDESSGLERTASGLFWSHNDGGPAELYSFNGQGQLQRTLTLDNADHKDWEDLALDDQGNLYIGDFGNNENDRDDLKIYRIPPPGSITGDQVAPETISFTLDDQSMFPPPATGRFFDIEAFFARGGFLYLLTRDRSDPFVGKTTLYRLPATPGSAEAVRTGEFFTANSPGKGAVTSADLSPDGTVLALLTNEAVWLFTDFTGDDFFSGMVTRHDLLYDRQMEGLVFLDNCTLYLTNEAQPGEPAALHLMKVCQ